MSKLEIFYDLDEVIVNLSKYVIEDKYNIMFNDNMKWTDNKSYWWSDCKKAPKKFFENLLQQPGTFLYPEPVEESIEYATKLHEEGFNLHMITMPQLNKYCVMEKWQWVQKYLPFIDQKHIHFTANKGLMANPNRILLDDNIEHLDSWESGLGISVAYDFCWNDDWAGYRIKTHEEFYRLVKDLS